MKKKLDLNQLAKSVVEQATGEVVLEKDTKPRKKAAQETGRTVISHSKKHSSKNKGTLEKKT